MTGKTIDKTTFKIQVGVAISVIIFLIGAAFVTGQKISESESLIKSLQEQNMRQQKIIDDNLARIKDLEDDSDNVNIKLAEINIKLANIELSLEEIKKGLNSRAG